MPRTHRALRRLPSRGKLAHGADAGCEGRTGRRGAGDQRRVPPARPARAALSLRALLCVWRAGGQAEGRGRAPAPASPRPLQGERRVPPRELPGRQVGPRAAEPARQQAAPAGGPEGAGPAAPRPPRPPLPPARAHTHTPSHPRAVFTFFSEKSEVRSERGRAEPPTPPRCPKPARSPHRASRLPQASGTPEAGPGSASNCASGGVSLLLLKDERGYGRLCCFSRTVAASAAASLHIQVENFQESAETLCPKKTESQLPPNPGGDSPWKTSLR